MTNELSAIESGLEQVTHAVSYMMTAPAAVITIVGCILLGYFIKLVPGLPNKFIPLINLIAGPVMFILMETGKPTHIAHPQIMFGVIGLGLSMASLAIHKTILRRWIDPKLFKPDDDSAPPFADVEKPKPQPKVNEP